MKASIKWAGVVLAASSLLATTAKAEEGMWTFDNFPKEAVAKQHGFTVTQQWLDHVRGAAVRLTSGCSASVVSPEGLVLTNHHCIVRCAQNLSDKKNDYVANGFLTASLSGEKQCPGMQAEILQSITDVTDKVLSAAEGKTGEDFVKARDAAIADIEKAACKDNDHMRCQVVNLYRGGQFKLYQYRKYSDVRLSFAPEIGAAFFGGDPDNFNFPRYAMDAAFIRLYENDKPAQTPTYLRWSTQGASEGDLLFVAGNPGSTRRLMTVAQMQVDRDLSIPVRQLLRSELRGRLIAFSERSAEHKRIATDTLFGTENSFKAFYGRHNALLDPVFFGKKMEQEKKLRAQVAANPKLRQEIGDPWGEIETAMDAYRELFMKANFLEAQAGMRSKLFAYARHLVRAADEREKPNGERMATYTEAKLPLLEKNLLDKQPIDPELEALKLSFWLSKSREYLTVDAPETQTLLGRESPEALAKRLVSGTKLDDPKVRKALWEGGAEAIAKSRDPLIIYARQIDEDARAVRKAYEARVEGPVDRAAERIAKARFALYGDSVYPDATFTLRLSYGVAKGWTYNGVTVPWRTKIGGLYDRATGFDPFVLPARWASAKGRLDLDTTYDFVSTHDIIGGNSGSPIINTSAEVVGAVFDGNIHSLGGAYGYDGRINRTVSVSTPAITEALRHVYRQDRILKELNVE